MQQYYAKFLFTKRSKLVFKYFTFMYHCRFPNNGKIKTIGLFYIEIKTHSSLIYEVELDYLIGWTKPEESTVKRKRKWKGPLHCGIWLRNDGLLSNVNPHFTYYRRITLWKLEVRFATLPFHRGSFQTFFCFCWNLLLFNCLVTYKDWHL